jgi:hypothetical protein
VDFEELFQAFQPAQSSDQTRHERIIRHCAQQGSSLPLADSMIKWNNWIKESGIE